NGINLLRAKVRSLRQDIEAEISLVLDVMLPATRVVDGLKAFRAEFPTVSLRLYIGGARGREADGAQWRSLDRNLWSARCGGRRDRAHRGRQRRVDPRCCARSPIGARGPEPAGRRAAPHPACTDGPLTAHQGPRRRRDWNPELAPG